METAFKPLFAVPWLGEETTDHFDPLNRTISVWFACSAAPTLPTAHHSSADTNAASHSSPPEPGAVVRLNEPHSAAAAWPAPASATLGTARRPGSPRPAVTAAPAAATPTTKLRRDTGAWPEPPCSPSRSPALPATAPPKNVYDQRSPDVLGVPLDAGRGNPSTTTTCEPVQRMTGGGRAATSDTAVHRA